MLKRLFVVVLLGGLLGVTPTAAAAPAGAAGSPERAARPAQSFDLHRHRDDDHRRCMYRCDERRGRDRYRHRDRHEYKRYRHRRHCWYRDRWGWYQAPCNRRHRW